MRTINRLVTVLILAGILTFGTVQGRTLNKDEKFLGNHRNDHEKKVGSPILNNVIEKLSELSGCVDFTTKQFEADMAHGRLRGDLGGVIRTYCRKVPAIEACVRNVTEIIEPRADSEEREILTVLSNTMELVFDYMCHNDGDRITTFLTNGGPACLAASGRSLALCAFKNFYTYTDDLIKDNSLPTGEDACSHVRNFQECSLNVLNECADPTPAKLFDSLMEYLLKVIQCDKLLYVHVFATWLADPLNLDTVSTQLLRYAKNKCAANGEAKAFYSLIEQIDSFEECTQSVVEKIHIAHERFTSDSQELTPVEFFKRFCNHVPQLERCGQRLTDSWKTCLDPTEFKTLDIVHEAGKSVMQFLCHREAEVLTEFADTGGTECFDATIQAMGSCARQLYTGYVFSKSGLEKNLEQFIITSDDCKSVKEFQDCVTKKLPECENQTPVDFFKSLMDSVLEPTPCVDFFETQTSPDSELVPGEGKSHKSFEEKCQINGGPTAFDNMSKSMSFVLRSIDLDTSTSHFRSKDYNEVLPLVYERFCRRGQILIELEKYMTKSLKPCLEPEEQNFLGIIDNVTSSTLQLICENEGEFLAALLNSDGQKCLNSKIEDVLNCGSEAFAIDSFDEGFIALGRYDKPLVLSAEDCTNLQKFRDCSVEVLAECDQLTTSHLTDYLLKYIEDATPCRNLLQAESSSSTEWTSSSTEQEEDVFGIGILLSLLPDENDWKAMRKTWDRSFRQMCIKNGGLIAYETARGLPEYIQDGVTNLQMSLHRLDADIKDASWGGRDAFDAIFFEYCDDVPSVKKYLKHIVDSLKPCLDQESRENLDFVYNTIESSVYFICDNDGERLAGFVDTGGVKCMAKNFEPVTDCIAESLNPVFPSDGPIVLGVEECQAIKSTEHCIVGVMDDCDSKTPAENVQDLINFLFEKLKCDDILKDQMMSSSYLRNIGQAIARVVG